MKTRAMFAVLMVSAFSLMADLITAWDFNSLPSDSATATGRLSPSTGSGSAGALGGISHSFSSGGGSDPASSTDDSAWQTTGYPGIFLSNKTAGVEFRASTVGYTNITLTWDQRNSGSASRFARLQYSLNGTTFVDGPVIAVYEDSVFTNQVVSLTNLPAAANNPGFAFRIVTEFASTAIGSSLDDYQATKEGSSYSSSGTIRFEMVKVQGALLPGANTAPWILASPTNHTLRVNEAGATQPLTILDAEDPATTLRVRAESSNPAVVPDANITLGGSGAYRTVAVRAGPVAGSALITLFVSDPGNRTNTAAFLVSVLVANTPPFLSTPPLTNTLVGVPASPLPFTIGDLESSATSLSVTAFSSNTAVLPASGIQLGGTGTNRTITLTPGGSPGVAPVTLSVSDGPNTTSVSFALMVLPDPDVVFWDPFDYAPPSLTGAAAGLYDTRSGTANDLALLDGRVLVSSTNTEDVVAPLAGGPMQRSNSIVLYASCNFELLGLPKALPEYFAHLVDGNTMRARIFVGTTNAPAGFFRLYVANGSDNCSPHPMNLATNTPYTAVWSYDVDNASTRLWINSVDETYASVMAVDPAAPVKITGIGLRQDAGLGTGLLVDNLRVGRTFASVTGTATTRPRLTAALAGGQLVVSWDTPGCTLQAGPTPSGPFTNVTAATSPFPASRAGNAGFFRLKTTAN